MVPSTLGISIVCSKKKCSSGSEITINAVEHLTAIAGPDIVCVLFMKAVRESPLPKIAL